MSKLIVVCGEPGVGKSRVAKHIADATSGNRLATDKIRKELFGPDPEYTQEESEAVYQEMFDRASESLMQENVTVLDATFMLKKGRQRAAYLARKLTHPTNFEIVRVRADSNTVEHRLRERAASGDSFSDAGVDVYRSIRDRFEPLEMSHTTIDNSGTWEETVDQIERKVVF